MALESEGNPPNLKPSLLPTLLQYLYKDDGGETLAEDEASWRTISISSIFGQFTGPIPQA